MAYQLTISPDFPPPQLAGWFIFNTWLQRVLGNPVHLRLFDSFQSQREAIIGDEIDLIYANPNDAALLVREKGFIPLASPQGSADEAVVAVAESSKVGRVEELAAGTRIASTDHPDVHMMGMIMLEPADLNSGNTRRTIRDSYVLVAKSLLQGDADVGFFLNTAFADMSDMVRKQLRPLVTSQIFVIHHCLLLGPRMADKALALQGALFDMHKSDKGNSVLEGLGIPSWNPVGEEEMEFLIDLISTLVD